MSLIDEINNDASTIISTNWSTRKGQKVPATKDVALNGGAVELDATFLYADLANSSRMAKYFDRRVTAKIIKCFLATTARIIRARSGSIVSFDGDRIMGVFVGGSKNSNAAKCSLNIKYIVDEVIRPKFEAKYESVRSASFKISHGVGVDTGSVLCVRAGARGGNDLIWIERAPNLAAKLSDLRNPPYRSHITASVFNKLSEKTKNTNGKCMWERMIWEFLGDNITIYKSSWHWKP